MEWNQASWNLVSTLVAKVINVLEESAIENATNFINFFGQNNR